MVIEKKFVSHVYVLVHPFYSIVRAKASLSNKHTQDTVKTLLRIWRREVSKVQKDPEAILVFWRAREYSPDLKESKLFQEWFWPKYQRFLADAQVKLGKRFFWGIYPKDIMDLPHLERNPANLLRQLEARGFTLRNRELVKGRAFGEYLEDCVNAWAHFTEKELNLGSGQVKIIQEASQSKTFKDYLTGPSRRRRRPSIKRPSRA